MFLLILASELVDELDNLSGGAKLANGGRRGEGYLSSRSIGLAVAW